ncbi:hypothetical protein [Gimesia algae]|uniref:hypothetical protein n=1 Tax=Gimesia algae TaxID=2527971 RepID=UPI0011AAC6C3|nr:hypothetical protein [Gimesia algae]
MGYVIDHFMWSFQGHFRFGVEFAAKKVFSLLDDQFEPEIFLVGVLVDNQSDRYPACVEPENDFWIQSKAFDSTLNLASEILETYPESEIIHTHPIAQKSHRNSLFNRSVRDAVIKIIYENASSQNYYYVSFPVRIGGYLVCIVLNLQKKIVDIYPSLKTSQVPIHEQRNANVAISLIDATTHNFLEKAVFNLNGPEPGKYPLVLNADEIIREAAYQFVVGLTYRVSGVLAGGAHGLFEACNRIAPLIMRK